MLGDQAARRWQIPLALFAGTLAIRVGAALQTAVLFNDGPSFLRVAGLFYQGDWSAALAHHYHPLYPFLTSLVARVTGDLETAGVTVSVLAGSAAVLPLYDFLRRAFDAQVAWMGGLLFALQPYAAMFSSDVQSEGLYFALFLCTVSGLWRAISTRSALWAGASGALAASSYWVRPEGLGLIAAGLGFAALLLFQGRWRASDFVRFGAALSLAGIVVAAPYVLHLHAATGEWMLTQKKSISDFTEPARESAVPRPGTPDRRRFEPPPMRRPAPRRAAILPARLQLEPRTVAAAGELIEVSWSALRPAFGVLLILGLYTLRGRPGDRGGFLLLIVLLYGVVLYGLALNVGYLNRRHVMAPLLPLLGYAALGAPVFGRGLLRLVRPRAEPSGFRASAWLAIGIAAAITLPKSLGPHRSDRIATRHAAEWLAARRDLSGPVAATKVRDAYYAGEAFVHLSRGGDRGDPALLQRAGAGFLVVDETEFARLPGLVAARDAGLVELYRSEAAGRVAYVYDLRLPGGPPD